MSCVSLGSNSYSNCPKSTKKDPWITIKLLLISVKRTILFQTTPKKLSNISHVQFKFISSLQANQQISGIYLHNISFFFVVLIYIKRVKSIISFAFQHKHLGFLINNSITNVVFSLEELNICSVQFGSILIKIIHPTLKV